ncbi:coenzyme PQQ synthesis protein D (PqqD) [Sphingomonas sp. F9_3S_D5_B_2]
MKSDEMSTIQKQADRFTETDIDQEIVVMRIDNGEFFSLAGTAAAAWRLIDGSRDRAKLILDLAGHYQTSQEEIAGEVDEFLEQLRSAGLLAST